MTMIHFNRKNRSLQSKKASLEEKRVFASKWNPFSIGHIHCELMVNIEYQLACATHVCYQAERSVFGETVPDFFGYRRRPRALLRGHSFSPIRTDLRKWNNSLIFF